MTIEVKDYYYVSGEPAIRIEDITNGNVFLIPKEKVIEVVRTILKVYEEI